MLVVNDSQRIKGVELVDDGQRTKLVGVEQSPKTMRPHELPRRRRWAGGQTEVCSLHTLLPEMAGPARQNTCAFAE